MSPDIPMSGFSLAMAWRLVACSAVAPTPAVTLCPTETEPARVHLLQRATYAGATRLLEVLGARTPTGARTLVYLFHPPGDDRWFWLELNDQVGGVPRWDEWSGRRLDAPLPTLGNGIFGSDVHPSDLWGARPEVGTTFDDLRAEHAAESRPTPYGVRLRRYETGGIRAVEPWDCAPSAFWFERRGDTAPECPPAELGGRAELRKDRAGCVTSTTWWAAEGLRRRVDALRFEARDGFLWPVELAVDGPGGLVRIETLDAELDAADPLLDVLAGPGCALASGARLCADAIAARERDGR